MWLHSVHRHFYPWFSAACLTILLLAACQPPAEPPATLAPTPSAPPSATITLLPATSTATAVPATLTATARPSATLSPTARPTIPTADFAPADVLGIWHRFDQDRGDLFIIFRDDGTYGAAHGSTDGIVHGGNYTLDGRLLTWVDGWDCSPMPRDTSGQYVLRILDGGKYLFMARYGDRCPDRPQALANFRWTRVIATPTPVP